MKYQTKRTFIDAWQVPPEGESWSDEQLAEIGKDAPLESLGDGGVAVGTAVGVVRIAEPGDFVIRSDQGEFYVTNAENFAHWYEAAD